MGVYLEPRPGPLFRQLNYTLKVGEDKHAANTIIAKCFTHLLPQAQLFITHIS